MARYLEENDDEQIAIIDLMIQIFTGTKHEPYSYTHMKARLWEHFGGRLIQTAINGKLNVTTARAVLQEYNKQQQKKDITKGKIQLLQAAGKLTKEDIGTI